jgi:hypothetical protein
MQSGECRDLRRKIGRGIDEKPIFIVSAESDAGLRSGGNNAHSRLAAIKAGTIPLG